jgi:hypothetical protein
MVIRNTSAEQFVVDIERRTCTCLDWQDRRIPCEHAICFMRHVQIAPETYIDRCYYFSSYQEMYKGSFRIISMYDLECDTTTHGPVKEGPVKKGRPSKKDRVRQMSPMQRTRLRAAVNRHRELRREANRKRSVVYISQEERQDAMRRIRIRRAARHRGLPRDDDSDITDDELRISAPIPPPPPMLPTAGIDDELVDRYGDDLFEDIDELDYLLTEVTIATSEALIDATHPQDDMPHPPNIGQIHALLAQDPAPPILPSPPPPTRTSPPATPESSPPQPFPVFASLGLQENCTQYHQNQVHLSGNTTQDVAMVDPPPETPATPNRRPTTQSGSGPKPSTPLEITSQVGESHTQNCTVGTGPQAQLTGVEHHPVADFPSRIDHSKPPLPSTSTRKIKKAVATGTKNAEPKGKSASKVAKKQIKPAARRPRITPATVKLSAYEQRVLNMRLRNMERRKRM